MMGQLEFESSAIHESVLDALMNSLQLDFALLGFDEAANPLVRLSDALAKQTGADGVVSELALLGAIEPRSQVDRVTIGGVALSLVHVPLGIVSSIGWLIAGARREAFPAQSERHCLSVAATQAALAFRELREPTRAEKQKFDALAESELKLRLTLDNIPAMAWSSSPSGSLDFCNALFCEYVGRSFEEIAGEGYWSIFHPDDLQPLHDAWDGMVASQRGGEVECRLRRADGVYQWFMVRSNPVFDRDGNLIKWYGVIAEIDDRKRAENALKASEAALSASERNLRLILDSLPVLAWSARPDGGADFVNRRWAEYVGVPADQILEWGFLDFYHPDDVAGMVDTWTRDLQTADQTILKGRIKRADGQYRSFLFAGRKITDANGVVRWIGANVDIEDLQRAERALRASEARLQEGERALGLMLDTIPAMAWSTTPDGMAEVFNKNMLDYLGRTQENMQGLGFLSQFHPDDVDRMVTEWQSMMASKRGGEIEGRVRRADGEYRWVICRCNPLLNAEGDVVRWYGANIDIEDRKHVENALRASEAALAVSERNLSLILNSLPVLVWSARADGSADFVNQSFQDYVGLPLEHVVDFGFMSVFHPDDVERMMATWNRNLGTAVSVMRGRIRRFDGEYRWFYFSGRKFEDANGNVRWFGVNVDIEDLTRAEDALREREVALRKSEARLQRIINTIPALVWSANAEGAANFISQHYLDYTGLSFEEAVGSGWAKALHPDDLDSLLITWRHRIETRSAGEHEARLRRADGQYRRFLFRHSPYFDDAGNLTQWFGVNIDIEDRKRAEEELRQSQTELAHITRMTTMGELTVSIAHEVNQPLMAIVTNAGTCLRWLDEGQFDLAQARQAAQRVIRDGHRAGDILASIRALARKTPPNMVRMDLQDAIDEVRELLKGELQRRGVESQIEFPQAPVSVLGDRTQLQQVILNLIMNGVEAMAASAPESRSLVVQVLRGGDGFAQVCVVDRGEGLDADHAERVFDPFFSTKPGGIGMGLSICRSIVEAHGGRIWAADNQPRGSVFCFTVPLASGGEAS